MTRSTAGHESSAGLFYCGSILTQKVLLWARMRCSPSKLDGESLDEDGDVRVLRADPASIGTLSCAALREAIELYAGSFIYIYT